MMPKIALASASPRRRELLTQLQQDFVIVQAPIDEQVHPAELAIDYVQRLALEKAGAGWQAQWCNHVTDGAAAPLPTLGADTIVVVDGEILGKPRDRDDFYRMMRLLSGRQHYVMTAIALVWEPHMAARALDPRHTPSMTGVKLVQTEVSFMPLSEHDIDAYWRSGEPQDKAGGYGIQGLGGRFVTHLSGSYFAVVGLPLYETQQLLAQLEAQ